MVIFSFKDVQHHQCLIKTQDRDKLIPKINFEGWKRNEFLKPSGFNSKMVIGLWVKASEYVIGFFFICSTDFICEIHFIFYLPLNVKNITLILKLDCKNWFLLLCSLTSCLYELESLYTLLLLLLLLFFLMLHVMQYVQLFPHIFTFSQSKYFDWNLFINSQISFLWKLCWF